MASTRKPVPIYTSDGDFEAYLVYPHLFNMLGEWIGYVNPEKEVYSVHGNYAGWLSDDPRILRKKSYDFSKPQLTPPEAHFKVPVPGGAPLPPMMADLTFDTIDVLQDEPDKLHPLDGGELRPDLD